MGKTDSWCVLKLSDVSSLIIHRSKRIPHMANPLELMLLALVFFLAVSAFSICIGMMLRAPEHATVLVLLTSLPIVFTAGFAWPASNLPGWLHYVTFLIPAKAGISGFVTLNQMGAPFVAILPEVVLLLSLFLVYFCAAVMLDARLVASRFRDAV